jgi:DNA-binding beta-propeller fold protein YncE
MAASRFNPVSPGYVAGCILAALLLTGCSSQPKSKSVSNRIYSFWPAAPDEPHVQFLAAFNSSQDVATARSGLQDAIYGREPQQIHAINKPYGVRLWNGRLYICDVRGTGITVLDLRKRQTRVMGATGSGTISRAVDLCITPDGTKYVVDAAQRTILVFNADERFVAQFPLGDSSPVGIAAAGERLYVTDFKSANVKVLDRSSGKLLRTIGERGGEDGQFIGPLAVAVDKDGNVYVSDTIRARVQKFSPDGKFLLGFGEPGDRPGNFVRPKHLGIGSDGHIHVVDAAFNNVQVFDPEGRVVGYYGAPGNHPGAMDLPAGLDLIESDLDVFAQYLHPAFDAERLIVVSNQFGPQKVSVYAMGHLKPGKTVADLAPTRASVAEGTLAAAPQPATQPSVSAAVGDTDARPRP